VATDGRVAHPTWGNAGSTVARACRGPTGPALRVLLLSYNPLIEAEGGNRLSAVLRWHDPDRLAAHYSADLHAASGGCAQYAVVERVEVDAWPRKRDGFCYDDHSFLKAWRRRSAFHQPDAVDYHAILLRFAIAERVRSRSIDEVWIFAPPYTGLWESTMVGPGAFWCNSPPVDGAEHCGRRFVVMGFNYERDVGCMLENFGHRTESIMRAVYRRHPPDRNMWDRFCRYDLQAPGGAGCGNIHFAPNSAADYDWGNLRPVWSDCDDWLSYPALAGRRREVHCAEWGSGDMRAHHLWWLQHLPRAEGTHDSVLNNWWRYVLDPTLA
jgi:hypothetical protein